MKLGLHEPIASLDYFVGRVCTVYTSPTNWNLNFDQNADSFVGIVNSVGDVGICLTNVVNGNKTFVFLRSVVGIAEETVVDPDDAEQMGAVREYEERKKQIFQHNPTMYQPAEPKPLRAASGFVDLKSLSAQAKAAKERSSPAS